MLSSFLAPHGSIVERKDFQKLEILVHFLFDKQSLNTISRTWDHDLSKGTEPCPWIERYQYEQPPYQPQDLPWWPLPCSRMPGQDLLQHAREYGDGHLHTSAHHHLKRESLH